MPPVPERVIAVRSSTSARCSSGVSLRAALTAGPGDVGVDVDPARHDDHPPRVDAAGVRRHVGDDLAVLDADVAHLAGDAVGGVVHAAGGDPEHHRRSGDRGEHVLDARDAPRPAARAAGPARRPCDGRSRRPRCRRRRWRTPRAPPPPSRSRARRRPPWAARAAARGSRRQVRQRIGGHHERGVDLAALEQRGGAELAGVGARVAAREAHRRGEAGLPGEDVLGAARVALARAAPARPRAGRG